MEQRQRFALMIVVVVVILGTGAWLIEDDMRNDQARKDRLVAPWRADRASFATLLKDGTDGQITFGQLDEEFLRKREGKNRPTRNSGRATI